MKKLICMLLILSLLAIPAVFASELGYVTDSAGLLTAEEAEILELTAEKTALSLGCGVYIITVEDYTDYADDVYRAAYGLYHQYSLGEGDGRNGILLLLSMQDRDYALFVYGPEAETAFSDYALRQLEDEFLDDLGYNDWYGGLTDYMETCREYLTLASQGKPVEENMLRYFPVVLIISVVVALVVCLVLKAQMKSVFKKAEADAYTDDAGLNLTGSRDMFIRTTRTKTKISSSSGGSSRSGGGGHGRSGKF